MVPGAEQIPDVEGDATVAYKTSKVGGATGRVAAETPPLATKSEHLYLSECALLVSHGRRNYLPLQVLHSHAFWAM